MTKAKILGALKSIVGAAVPFGTIWAETGAVDYRALIAAVVGAALVYVTPNLNVEPTFPPDEQITR